MKTKSKKITEAFSKKWSAYWNVTPRSINRWLKDGAPVSDPVEMEKWLRVRQSVPPGAEKTLKKLRVGQENPVPKRLGKTTLARIADDPDWTDYQKAKSAAPKKPDGATDVLEEYRDFYTFKLARATQTGDERSAKAFAAQLITFDKAIRENKLMADRLGLDASATIPREDVEKWLRAFGFWTMRCVDAILETVVPALAGLAPTLTSEMVRNAIEPSLIEARSLRPFVLATKVTGGCALPEWVVAVVKDTVDDYVSEGNKHFDDLSKAIDNVLIKST